MTREQALAVARQRGAELRQGKRLGSLHGIPIAIKDNIDTAGVRTTAASELFTDRVPDEDAEVVRGLKDAGAISLGARSCPHAKHRAIRHIRPPAITVPCGFSTSGLPMGLQIVGAPFAESTVLSLAHA